MSHLLLTNTQQHHPLSTISPTPDHIASYQPLHHHSRPHVTLSSTPLSYVQHRCLISNSTASYLSPQLRLRYHYSISIPIISSSPSTNNLGQPRTNAPPLVWIDFFMRITYLYVDHGNLQNDISMQPIFSRLCAEPELVCLQISLTRCVRSKSEIL
jgi:hypothetical protein